MRAPGALALCLAAAPAAAPGGLPGDVSGDWVGAYTCVQGVTALDLAIKTLRTGELRALFHFRADPSNPGVPEGCYAMTGVIAGSQVSLKPDRWLLQPRGFSMVGLEGRLAQGRIEGRISFPGCTSFEVARASAPPDRALACAPPEVVAGL